MHTPESVLTSDDPTLAWPSALPEVWTRVHSTEIPYNLSSQALEALRDRAQAAYLGLAIGDALGATLEFMTPREIKAKHGVHKDIIGGGWLHLKPGRVTDDTEMSLALGKAILDRGGQICARSIADSFSAWMSSKPVDIGHTVRRGISNYRRFGQTFVADSEHNAGNGAVMRTLPVALVTYGAPWDEVLRAMRLQAHITHTSSLADAGCEVVVCLIHLALSNPAAGISDLSRLVEDFSEAWPAFAYSGKREEDPTGFVVHTLRAVFQVISSEMSFEDGVIDIVNRGGDADTTGAILGMILGALYGTKATPKRWLKKLDPAVRKACIEQAQALISYAPALSGIHRKAIR